VARKCVTPSVREAVPRHLHDIWIHVSVIERARAREGTGMTEAAARRAAPEMP